VREGHARDVRTTNTLIAVIAVASGAGLALAGPSPTGSNIIDAGLLVVVGAVVVWVIAAAPWVYDWAGTQRPVITAIAVGGALQALARLGNIWRFGFSAAVAIVPVLILTMVAIHQRSGQRRVQMWSAFGGFVAALILALIGFGVAAASARPNLTRGTDEAKLALRSLKSGNFDEARREFDLAAGLLSAAANDLDAPWAQPARLMPVVAQNRQVAAHLAEAAAGVSETIVNFLDEIDFDQLRVVNGAIDISAIRALEVPLARLTAALAEFRTSIDSADSPWLVDPVRTRLAAVTKQIGDQQVEGARAIIAVQRAPAMLGANDKRTYFVAFTTPAEGRGLGGFMGNWAEVTVDNGHISVTNFGRTADLAIDGDIEHWIRITSSPHFPDVAKLIADGYAAYSGHTVDGVFAMDVYTLSALMTLTGPIDLTTIGQTVSADTAAKLLLSDQYAAVQDPAQQIDLLDDVARATIDRMLSTSLPAPPNLIKLLSPFAAQGRLDGWSSHPDEEDWFARMRMAGELPALNAGDGLGVVINNIGNNKIDYYLTGETSYSVTTAPASDQVNATLDITLNNSAPAGISEPSIVFGNSQGAPAGTNVMEMNIYSALLVTGVTVDSASKPVDRRSTDHGFQVSTLNLQIPAHSTMKISVTLAGPLDLTNGYHAIIRIGASVNPLKTAVIVDGTPAKGSPYRTSGTVEIDGAAD
jgi:hypothetical protein